LHVRMFYTGDDMRVSRDQTVTNYETGALDDAAAALPGHFNNRRLIGSDSGLQLA
jgi:hypothetical protein